MCFPVLVRKSVDRERTGLQYNDGFFVNLITRAGKWGVVGNFFKVHLCTIDRIFLNRQEIFMRMQ